jgi:hypothetical protein
MCEHILCASLLRALTDSATVCVSPLHAHIPSVITIGCKPPQAFIYFSEQNRLDPATTSFIYMLPLGAGSQVVPTLSNHMRSMTIAVMGDMYRQLYIRTSLHALVHTCAVRCSLIQRVTSAHTDHRGRKITQRHC